MAMTEDEQGQIYRHACAMVVLDTRSRRRIGNHQDKTDDENRDCQRKAGTGVAKGVLPHYLSEICRKAGAMRRLNGRQANACPHRDRWEHRAMTQPIPDERTDAARMRAILAVTAAVAFITLSYLAPDFRGYSTDQMPHAELRPPVQPAGYAFAIWGVIYPWLLISAGYGLFKRADAPDWDPQRWPLIGAMVLGAGWLWIAVQNPVLATVVIFAMLGFALLALARTPTREFWLARAPVGLFAGWLTAASFVSLGVVLAGFGVLGSGRIAALMMIVVAAGVATLVMTRLRPGGTYPFAVGWGLAGIAVVNADTHIDVTVLALAGAALLVLLWWRGRG